MVVIFTGGVGKNGSTVAVSLTKQKERDQNLFFVSIMRIWLHEAIDIE